MDDVFFVSMIAGNYENPIYIDEQEADQKREENLCPVCYSYVDVEIEIHVNQCLDKRDLVAKVEKKPLIESRNDLHPFKRKRAGCPDYKFISGTSLTMDAFNYGIIHGCDGYFLSHFHSDHYNGLTKNFNQKLFCSSVTANLVMEQIGVAPEFIHVLNLEERIKIQNNIYVTLIDANHCPGACIFLFEILGENNSKKRILHTGDFRATTKHINHPLLRASSLDILYLDTTYLDPKHTFPSQDMVIDTIVKFITRICLNKESIQSATNGSTILSYFQKIRERPSLEVPTLHGWLKPLNPTLSPRSKTLIVVGTYLIGKEKIFLSIAKSIGSKIYAESSRRKVYASQQDPVLSSLLVTDPKAAFVHSVPIMNLNKAVSVDVNVRNL